MRPRLLLVRAVMVVLAAALMTLVSLDDAGPVTSVELKVHAFHQACARE